MAFHGKIYAIPFTFQLNYLAISPSMIARSGLGEIEIPSTFPEFLDFLDQWIAYLMENPDCDVALLGMSYWGDESFYKPSSYTAFLVEQLLENTIMQNAYAGEPLTFDETELVPLLERCYQIGQDLYTYDAGVQTSYFLLQSVMSTSLDGYDFLSLRLNRSQPKLIQIYVNLYAANAGTDEPELCIELMEALCVNNWPMYNAYFYQDSEPLPDPQYDSRVADMQQQIADTQLALSSDTLDASDQFELEERLQRQQNNFQKLLENENAKYLVTPDQLEWFRSCMDCMFVQMPGIFNANYVENTNTFKQLQSRFVAGQISAQKLVTELNRIAWMIEMETE